jgi:GDPmannose 4,6-dehydratase
MTNNTNLIRIVQETQPDEIYNLGAKSHVNVSFESPEYTANADGVGTLKLLEAVRISGLQNKTRIYQAKGCSNSKGIADKLYLGNQHIFDLLKLVC